ncbi:peroxidase family protein [Reyranella sp. CPCC 100927]|uniref:peroxidase family protein n=1 Tax=Reyranella sp. CPCC 100927 TaxID=2599616 RepID=UPI0011B565B9|nr:peroxidase family protein [Reyranella sp. CPCC 100927]TWT01670.1 hypothetical protein FQU96_31795 [Reyranella sp. CPCC 100927]
MVTYIRSDLDFILEQIKISEAHANGQPLFGPGGLIPAYNISWGLRTVNGEYNNLLHPEWGSADNPFPEPLGTDFRPAQGTPLDMDGPGPQPPIPTAPNYNPSNNPNSIVVDSSVRTISNLIVDQTLDNPAAIMVALQRAGAAPGNELATALTIKAEYQLVKPLFEDVQDTHRANVEAQRTLESAQQAHDTNPTPETQVALDAATAAAALTQDAFDTADGALTAARGPLDDLLEANGIEMEGINIHLPNSAPDEGLSASFNSWFTLFGQFFDHGLDLVSKGGSGTVFIPLQTDDPLYDPTSPTNFMVLTRATVSPGIDGVMGTDDDVRPVNTTTSFVDQNQTYTSHASHQVFLREYALNASGRPEATGALLDGANGGLPTWGEVKAQAREMLGIDLTDYHVGNLPLLATDEYGNFIPNPVTGFPQVVMVGPPPTLASGTPDAPLSMVTVTPNPSGPPTVTHLAERTGHAFLDDIAHTAVPVGKIADGDTEIGLGNPGNGSTEYDNELLDAHYVTGDGRGNENIGLTAVHHVFHAEHNRLLEHTKSVVLATNDLAFINEWLDVPLAALPTPAQVATLDWNGERLFQAAKFGTEMQYQHLVFEEFARKIQPNINVFVVPDGFDVTIDPTIVAEFAHVVYRFGHSMLTESIDRYDPDFNAEHIGLIEGFLNPLEFAELPDDQMAGSIIRGMTRQVGNEIDEFVTSALRNNLLGLPLDLATINLARGRDTGVPSLNDARAAFYAATNNDSILKPYESWVEFAGNLKNEASIINFIAAYGTHPLITGQTTLEGKRDAALTLITGVPVGIFADDPAFVVPADAVDFLNGTGAYNAANALGGLNNVDLWIGGLAERIMPFGGMLGSTFNFVFEMQMEKLQNGDRFYYLQRLDGLHLFGEMENNSFAAMIMRNTDATHLPSDVFSTPGLILEVDRTKQFNPSVIPGRDGILEDDPTTAVDESADNRLATDDPLGGSLLTPLVIRNNPATPGTDTNYLRYTGDEHVVLGGTDAADILIASIGDDTLYGDGGNDRLEGGFGNDIINGGAGDDIIRDTGGDDNIKAGDGNDVVHAGPGLDLVMGGAGQDFIFLGTDMGSEVFAGEGNDFIYGNKNAERILGNEGDDWIETGTFDGAPGDNFDEIFARDGVVGHDVFLGDGGFDEFIAEGGDDIMVGSPGRGKMAGMSGWDWATYKDNTLAVDADLTRGIVFDENPTPPPNGTLDAYESVEGLSGTRFNDILVGADTLAEERVSATLGGTEGYTGSALTREGIQRIAGLAQVLGLTDAQVAALAAGTVVYNAGEIILGGDGSDTIMGRAGDDIIDGDRWLDVRIGVFNLDVNGQRVGAPIETHASMTTLADRMFSGEINPAQLSIVRDIKIDTTAGDIDIARYQGNRSEYAFGTTAAGEVTVTHIVEDSLDGSDRLRNIERLQFLDGTVGLVVGTGAGETLNGTAGDDLILGLGGNDTLNGLGGNDILVGGTGNDTLNGGAGDDTYSFSPGDGTDTIQETSGTDRISITAGVAPATLTALNFFEVTTGGGNDNLVIQFNGQQVTVNDHFDTAGEAVEFVNFNGATFNGYLLDDDYALSTDDNGTRDATVPLVNTILVGTTGEDTLNGNTGNDLLFGHDDDDTLNGGDGDDLLVGGAGNDTLDGGADLDTMVGGAGNDDYVVDDIADVIVEAAGAGTGTDEVLTELAAYTLGANVENLTYTGIDASAFAGTGNTLGNVITGGDLNDTLVGLAGADTLDGGLGADSMAGGADNDVYVVDDAGDVVNETAADSTGIDRVVSSINYTLGTGVENLDLTGTATDGTGNTLNNVIQGNDAANQLFGAGGSDTLSGFDGNDLLDGGEGVDTLNGGDDNDTIIGGAGNDLVDVGGGFNTIVYNATGFGDDVINSFDSAGGTAATQDLIDLRGLGVTAANFTSRVFESTIGGAANTLITIRENGPASAVQGTIRINGSNNAAIDISDFLLATAGNVITGNNTGQTHNGTAGNDTIDALGGADTVNGNAGDDTIIGGTGNDTLNGNDGSDTFIWNAAGPDGRDVINGGTEGAAGDIFVINGTAGAEQYYVYTRAAWDALPGNSTAGFNAGTEIVVTRNGTGAANIIAELREIEEIRINGVDPTAAGGTAAGDTFTVVGDFSGTSLRPNTVTMVGNGGDDTVNIAGLTSEHSINFTSNGGSDTLVGALRPQDVVNGAFAGPGEPGDQPEPSQNLTGTNGRDTLKGGAGADTLSGRGDKDLLEGGEGNDTIDGGSGNDTAVFSGPVTSHQFYSKGSYVIITGPDGMDVLGGIEAMKFGAQTFNLVAGTIGNNPSLVGGSGADLVLGFDGADVLRGNAGADVLFGGAGGDRFEFDAIGDSGIGTGNRDVVLDFARGQDVFDLVSIDANAGVGGNQDFTFIGTAAFTAAGQVRYALDSEGGTLVQANVGGSNGNAADFEVRLHNYAAPLLQTDFLL